MQKNKTIVKVKDLSVRYCANTFAVKNVSLDINRGDFLLIVGKNGSGKSTLVKALLGLLPCAAGKVEYIDSETKKKIGYLPQAMEIQKDFPATVTEVVLSGFVGKKGVFSFYTARDKKKVKEITDYLGIEKLLKKSFGELSGGERQKVLLARALVCASYCDVCREKRCSCHEETFCHTNGLIVLDEPSNGLDPVANRNLYEILEKLRREKGMTVVMVSHLVDSAAEYADKILHMDTEAVFYGDKDEYLKTELGKRFFGKESLEGCGNE